MKRNFYLFIAIFILFVIVNDSVQAQEKNYTVNETSITSANGEAFTITLDANHTTGYSWSAAVSDSTVLMIEGTSYVTPETHVMGKGGQEVWKLRSVMPGNVTVTFNYARPFDKDSPPAKTVTFNVTVQ